jgi:hypothetical protein
MNINPEDGGSTVSETLVSTHLTAMPNNPEIHDVGGGGVLLITVCSYELNEFVKYITEKRI